MVEDHRPYEEELAAYLLDALGEDEARAFHAHLVNCSRCRSEERWLRGALEVLPSSVEQLEPPPELRQRLMDVVRSEAADESPRPVRARRRTRARFTRFLRPAAALAGAAVVAAGVAGYLIRGGEGTKTTTVPVASTLARAGGAVVRSGKSAVLQVHGLPLQRPGHVYEVWLKRKGNATVEPSTLFVVRRDGRGSAAIPGVTGDVQQLLVTLEPNGGSKKPTTKPLLKATLQ
jgi:anti-sigma-K factor RskA